MIQLTRLNNKPLVVNADLIKVVEQAPDTLVTLITGEKIVVRQSVEQIITRVVEFRRSVLRGLPLDWDGSAAHSPLLERAPNPEGEPER